MDGKKRRAPNAGSATRGGRGIHWETIGVGSMRDWRKEKGAFAVFSLPGTFWIIVFFTLPLLIVWVYSFCGRGPQGQIIPEFSLDNYLRAIEPIHLRIIGKSLVIAAISTIICLLVGFPMAMGIAFAPPKWKNPLLVLVALPFFTNQLVRTYAWIAILRTNGYLNQSLGWAYDGLVTHWVSATLSCRIARWTCSTTSGLSSSVLST